jgi:subtilisin family serine protease
MTHPRPSRLALCLLLLAPLARAQFCPLDAETTRRIVSCRDGVGMEQCEAAARTAGCEVVRRLPLIHAVVIKVPLSRLPQSEARLSMNRAVDGVYASERKHWLESTPLMLPAFVFPDMGELPRFVPSPAAGEPARSAPAPEAEQPWGVRRVHAAAAWAHARGAGVKVAVIDTGIEQANAQLHVLDGFNAVDPAHTGAWDDKEGHGTHVAGTIAALQDGEGVVGVAPDVSLYAVRVLDENGNGTYDDVIAGLDWAVANHMQVVNMSLGADEGSPALELAIKEAARHLVIVAASGNAGGPVSFPARYPEAIAVGASTQDDKTAYFSNRGPEVAFIAPGYEIPSLKRLGGIETMSGTSMAAPHVTGLAALALSMGATDVRAALTAASTRLPGSADLEQGAGLPDQLR